MNKDLKSQSNHLKVEVEESRSFLVEELEINLPLLMKELQKMVLKKIWTVTNFNSQIRLTILKEE